MQVVQGREGGAEGLPIDQVAFSPGVAYRVSKLSVSGQGDQTAPSGVTRRTTHCPFLGMRDVAWTPPLSPTVFLNISFIRYSLGYERHLMQTFPLRP